MDLTVDLMINLNHKIYRRVYHMRIAFISDIHGNAIALDAVLNDIKKKKIDRICVLGDLCYRGPEPKRSLDLIRSLNTEVIKGNADEWVVRGVREGEVPDKVLKVMNLERDWTVSQLDRSDIEYLENLPTEIKLETDGVSIHAFHATPDSLFEVVPPSADDELLQSKLMSLADSNLYIYAHIHKPYIRYIGGKAVINIGSVGLPFDGLAKASYVIVEVEGQNIRTSIERVGFDVERVVQKYHDVKYPYAEMMGRKIRNASV
jgi:putative phosphoesterase